MKTFLEILILSFVLIVDFFILLSFLAIIWSASCGAPYVPTGRKIARKMIELAKIKKGDRVYDLGCGDGRLVTMAAEKGARATGFEISPLVFLWAQILQLFRKTKGEILWKNIWKVDISDADIIFLYLFPEMMKRFDTDFYPKLKKGTRIVAHGFRLKNHKPVESWQPEKGKRGKLFVYKKK